MAELTGHTVTYIDTELAYCKVLEYRNLWLLRNKESSEDDRDEIAEILNE